ncbi:hypothetical protein [Haloplasma contractile]|uniref:Uncharacterized protein n=1 Tax=Haloplasma contractile SSD-17B TaxID=1033810 RepID=U2DZB3_9MOLU|nr:hypothetical protein [Haloplasma contractile]ERJ13552.1 hypothetical protein HLPCO_000218 [Haloplasma contractile SSD-17B]
MFGENLLYNATNVGLVIYFGCILFIYLFSLKHKAYGNLRDITIFLVIGLIIVTKLPNNIALYSMAVIGNIVLLTYHYVLEMRGNKNRTKKEIKTMRVCMFIPLLLLIVSILYRTVIVGDHFDLMMFVGLVLLTIFIVVIRYNERTR